MWTKTLIFNQVQNLTSVYYNRFWHSWGREKPPILCLDDHVGGKRISYNLPVKGNRRYKHEFKAEIR